MKQKYPKLSEYLLSMFKYNKYRIIEAHDIPKIRISNGIAYIPVSGTKKEVEMNLEEIKTMLNTYSYFIKALNLVSNYKL
jgi:peptidase E